jgi:TolB-like protein/DNA-binding winged helix-turn-helix (wHTH) protein/Flp pilus assembly protein TadD
MAARPFEGKESIPLADGYELDLRPRRLRRGGRTQKLERIPLELLFLLVEHNGEIVSREQIVSRIWGEGVFLDTDNSIRGAVRKLRQVLKDNAESPRFIQTVTGQGYRFIAPVIEAPVVDAPVTDAADPVALQDNGKVRPWRPSAALGALALVCIAVVVVTLIAVYAKRRPSEPATASGKTVLAILPFENLSRDPDQEFFSDGLTEEMIAQTGKLNRARLAVVARSSVAKYKGSTLSAKEIARDLNADYLLQGSVRHLADRVRITVQLIHAQNQTDVWTEVYDRQLTDVLAVQESVVRSIASQIHIALAGEEEALLTGSRRVRPEAYVAYLKGRYYWNKRTRAAIEKAETYFQDAIRIDPAYGAAYSGLADCNSGLTWHGFRAPADALPKAYAAARKAIEINPQSAEAHASLGLMLSHGWEWAGAEAEFRRALELDPQYPNTHHWYGDYLSIHGRHEQALSEARRALELDPLNLMISTWVGLRLYLAHNYSAAIEQNRDSVELDPNFAAAHLLLGQGYVQAGTYGEGINQLRQAATLSGDSPIYTAQVAVALGAAGRRHEALEIANALRTSSRQRYVSPYGLAQIYAVLQNGGETFRWLEAAYDDRAVWMAYLAVDPVFDRYRSDQRFQELLRRVGLRR